MGVVSRNFLGKCLRRFETVLESFVKLHSPKMHPTSNQFENQTLRTFSITNYELETKCKLHHQNRSKTKNAKIPIKIFFRLENFRHKTKTKIELFKFANYTEESQ